jgi:alcohol dehydrogenase (cytochrome c)
MKSRTWIVGLVLVLGAAGAVAGIDQLRWRAQVVGLHVAGRIPDISLGELLAMLRPGSGQWLEGMVENRSPYETVVNPFGGADDVARGAEIFGSTCAGCHGGDASGTDVGPALAGRELRIGNTPWAVFRAIRYGVPGTSMPPHDRSDRDTWQLVAFVASVNRPADGAGRTAAVPALTAAIAAPYDEIRAPGQPAADWLTYAGDYSGARHSTLTAIGPANVAALAPRWIHQLEGKFNRLETSPIVRAGVMYVTVPPLKVLALDAATGETLWSFEEKVPADIRPACCDGGPVNRGVAILGDKLFIGTADARLIAISARTGKKLWETQLADYRLGYSVTAAPLAFGNLVAVGVGSGDFATRCFLAAFDADTGAERWRFHPIPAPGEPGHDTWPGETWKTGGSAPWMTGTYDPELDLLFWGVGNAVPKYDATLRKGDNLYSNSILALRAGTGELAWYFQANPGDGHGWGMNHAPLLADLAEAGGVRRNVLVPARNGFYYRLDRERGTFLLGTPFAKQTWAEGLDASGRPIVRPEAEPNRAGVAVWPGNGATNWWSSSYDPRLGLVFVPTHEKGLVFLSYDQRDPAPGEPNFEGGIRNIPGGEDYWAVRALRAATGELAWEHRFEPHADAGGEPGTGGLMSTATGLVFGGHQKAFHAWDSASGQLLWSFPVGKGIAAAPVSYAVGGEQYVAIAAGRLIVAFGVPPRG